MQACADWVIFMSSGIASAFYHSCDVGSWCALSFKPLQVHDLIQTFLLVLLFLSFGLKFYIFTTNLVSVYGLLAFFLGCGEHFCVPNCS
jgi:hypothetical protein